MNLSQSSPRLKRRNLHWFTVGCVTAGLFFVQALAILLAAFDAATWRIKAFLAALALGKSHAIRDAFRPIEEVTVAPSPSLRQNSHHFSSSIVLRPVAIRE